MKNVLSIGEISKLFCINIQTLLYYDSIGLFIPAYRNPENNFRQYSFDQIYQLAAIRYLRNLGYSLKKVKSYMESRDIDHTLDLLRDQSAELNKKAEELLLTHEAIQRKIQFIECEFSDIDTDSVSIREYPDRHFIVVGIEERLYGSEAFYLYPTVVIYEGNDKYFAVDAQHVDETQQDDETQQIRFIPGGRFLCGYHQGEYEIIRDSITRIGQSHENMEVASLSIHFNIIDQFVEQDRGKYVTMIQRPIVETEHQREIYY